MIAVTIVACSRRPPTEPRRPLRSGHSHTDSGGRKVSVINSLARIIKPGSREMPTCDLRRVFSGHNHRTRVKTVVPRQFASDPEHWRQRAAEARELANQMPEGQRKRIMLRIAR